jgi:hypothetical protein
MRPNDVILGGTDKQKALEELQKSVQGQLNLSMDATGKVSYAAVSGATVGADATQLTTAINDHSITVNVDATNNKTTSSGNLFIGGAFGGNTVIDATLQGPPGREVATMRTDPLSNPMVQANQEINPTVLAASDAPYGKPGGNTLHEVTEAYQGAKLSQVSGVSSGNGRAVGSVYSSAHSAATPQAGPIYQNVLDARGNIIPPSPTGTFPGGVKVEYIVRPTGRPSSVIMTYP